MSKVAWGRGAVRQIASEIDLPGLQVLEVLDDGECEDAFKGVKTAASDPVLKNSSAAKMAVNHCKFACHATPGAGR